MSKSWIVPDSLCVPIQNYYSARTSGATLPLPNYFPPEFETIGIKKRGSDRNEYYGMVVTNPHNYPYNYVFGFSYLDKKDCQADEDLYVFDFIKKKIEYFPRGSYEEENSLYADTHKGIKDYLIP